MLAPLAVLCLYIGLQPAPLTDSLEAPIERTLAAYPEAVRQHLAGADEAGEGQPLGLTLAAPDDGGEGGRDG